MDSQNIVTGRVRSVWDTHPWKQPKPCETNTVKYHFTITKSLQKDEDPKQQLNRSIWRTAY